MLEKLSLTFSCSSAPSCSSIKNRKTCPLANRSCAKWKKAGGGTSSKQQKRKDKVSLTTSATENKSRMLTKIQRKASMSYMPSFSVSKGKRKARSTASLPAIKTQMASWLNPCLWRESSHHSARSWTPWITLFRQNAQKCERAAIY